MSKQLFSGSIGRKFAMALSALFLIIFLLQHFTINFTSIFSEETFNELSHFMGTNPLVQFVLQPVLMFGVAFHFIMGFILEIKNRDEPIVTDCFEAFQGQLTLLFQRHVVAGPEQVGPQKLPELVAHLNVVVI